MIAVAVKNHLNNTVNSSNKKAKPRKRLSNQKGSEVVKFIRNGFRKNKRRVNFQKLKERDSNLSYGYFKQSLRPKTCLLTSIRSSSME